MRMIRGSGLVSTFFAYKNGSELSGAAWEELDLEVLGKNDAKTWQSNIITGKPRVTSEQLHSSPTSLADGYHTYTLEWTPEYVSWSFDGVVVRTTEAGQVSSLTEPATFASTPGRTEPRAGSAPRRSRASGLPVRQLDQVLPLRKRPVRARLDRRFRHVRFQPLGAGELDVQRQPRGLRSHECRRSGWHADPCHHQGRRDGIQRHRSHGRRQRRTVTPNPPSDSGCSIAGMRSPDATSGSYMSMAGLGLAALLRKRRHRR